MVTIGRHDRHGVCYRTESLFEDALPLPLGATVVLNEVTWECAELSVRSDIESSTSSRVSIIDILLCHDVRVTHIDEAELLSSLRSSSEGTHFAPVAIYTHAVGIGSVRGQTCSDCLVAGIGVCLVFVHLSFPEDTRVIHSVWERFGSLGSSINADSSSEVCLGSIGFSHELYLTLGHGLIGEPSECHLCFRIAVDVYHYVVWCLIWLKCLNLSLQFSYVSISRVATCCLFSNHHLDVRRYGIIFCLILSICLDNEWVEYLLLHLERSSSGVTTIFCGNRDSRCTRFQTDNGTLVQRSNSWVSDRPGDIAVSSIHWQDVRYDLYGVGSINVQRCWVKFYTCNSHQFCQSPTCVTNVQAIGSSTQGWRTWTEVEVTTLWIYEERIRGEAARVGRTRFSFTIVVNGVFYFTTIDIECILVGIGRVSHNTIGNAQVRRFADSDTTQVRSCTIVHGDVINHHLVLLTSSLAT